MLSAAANLERVEALILATGGVPRPGGLLRVSASDTRASLHLALVYESGHQFGIALTVTVRDEFPLWIRYNFHLQNRAGRCVFRYDNAPHYPELLTFPDHKHVGPDETAQEHLRPSLRHILTEVERHVAPPPRSEGGQPPPRPG